jgi:hypothetical protein
LEKEKHKPKISRKPLLPCNASFFFIIQKLRTVQSQDPKAAAAEIIHVPSWPPETGLCSSLGARCFVGSQDRSVD